MFDDRKIKQPITIINRPDTRIKMRKHFGQFR